MYSILLVCYFVNCCIVCTCKDCKLNPQQSELQWERDRCSYCQLCSRGISPWSISRYRGNHNLPISAAHRSSTSVSLCCPSRLSNLPKATVETHGTSADFFPSSESLSSSEDSSLSSGLFFFRDLARCFFFNLKSLYTAYTKAKKNKLLEV